MRNEDAFVLVEASKLSLDDEFMKYRPKNERERKFKELLTKAIQKDIKDFYCSKYDPSLNEDGTGLFFKAGEKPAVGISYNWWEKVAKRFMPKRHSRLGTKSEYVIFLGVLIKKLVEDRKWSVEKAWNAVCNDSKELGHYWSCKDAKLDFEDTGMREICGFFDLANTCKIIAEDEDDCTGGYWVASGSCGDDSAFYPLASLMRFTYRGVGYNFGTGWLILERGENENEA